METSIRFNQSHSHFSVASSSGFRVFSCSPFKETVKIYLIARFVPESSPCSSFAMQISRVSIGGVATCELLFSTNLIALVGGSDSPAFPPTQSIMWDDAKGQPIGELVFRSNVKAVRLRRDRVVVALEHKVLVYQFEDFKLF